MCAFLATNIVFAQENLGQGKFFVFGYVTSNGKALPNPKYITHANYAFAHIKKTLDGVQIDNPKRLREVVNCKKNSTMKVLLSLGGWGSGYFSEAAANPRARKDIARSLAEIVKEFSLDGIDIDWEFPTMSVAKISASKNDTKNLTLFLKEIRFAIGKNKLLTLASAPSANFVDWTNAEKYLDYIHIMSYNMDSNATHHSALWRSKIAGALTCRDAILNHLQRKVPRSKLTLGIPFFARDSEKKSIHYNSLPKNLKILRCDKSKAPYMVDKFGNFVLGFDDEISISAKCKLVKNARLAGVMFWALDCDDVSFSLTKSVAENLLSGNY